MMHLSLVVNGFSQFALLMMMQIFGVIGETDLHLYSIYM